MDKTKALQEIKNIDFNGKSTITLYNEISQIVMKNALQESQEKPTYTRSASYLSMEFLIGRMFYNNLLELDILKEVSDILKQNNIDISTFEEIEDAALGNGGLGRLAACFLDSGAAVNIKLNGFGIRYKYGLFKQAIENGLQAEYPDDWQKYGDPFSIRKEKESITISFKDFDALAVPYDMPVFGNNGKTINYLRLYQAEGCENAQKISEYLYPDDSTESGLLLRIRQEYFFSAAAVQDLLIRFFKAGNTDLNKFADYNAIQLNDTHPVMAIAEFIRLMTKEYGYKFDDAVKAAKKVFNYTNHTIMGEALEKWNIKLLGKILPDIAKILKKLNKFADKEFKGLGADKQERYKMAIYKDKTFHMANAAVYAGQKVNGVAKIHSEIIKKNVFNTAYKFYPDKFLNQTNGITQRRWLHLCDNELCEFIDAAIGDAWHKDFDKIEDLKAAVSKNTAKLTTDFLKVKHEKKRQLKDYIQKHEGITIDDNSIIFSQVKRLHEYKRQFMTALGLYMLYADIKSGKIKDFYPSTFIFGAKAAPAYKRAKGIIKYINEVAKLINSDPEVSKVLKVVYVQNYNVSYAEKIIPATDVSLQVSAAGTEASGTGNMKFMMNGAVTLGTWDGANIEIADKAGAENNYLFGATEDDLVKIKNTYSPSEFIKKHPDAENALNSLINGEFSDGGALGDSGISIFKDLYDSLTIGASWHRPDNYFVLYDLIPFVETVTSLNSDYKESKLDFSLKAIQNIASSAYFSSDRTIKSYAKEIWKLN